MAKPAGVSDFVGHLTPSPTYTRTTVTQREHSRFRAAAGVAPTCVIAALMLCAEACRKPVEQPRVPLTTASASPLMSMRVADGPAAKVVPADTREPPAPLVVDTSLSAPEYAELVSTAPDGASLLAIHGWRAVSPKEGERVESDTSSQLDAGMAHTEALAEGQAPGMAPQARTNIVYLAVLDARRECIEETLSFDALAAVGDTGTVAEALAALNVKAVDDEIHRAFSVARRFGMHDLGDMAFGSDEGFVVVEANNQLYVRSGGSGAPFTHHPIGTSTRLAASPDGTQIAFANCGSPCGGTYAPAILDTKTKKVRRFPVGNAHEFYWSKDGTSLVFSYDDKKPGQYDATKVCLGQVVGSSKHATTLKCIPSGVMSASISAASPSTTFVALQLESHGSRLRTDRNGKVIGREPATGPSPAFVVLEVPSGVESYRIAASPIYSSMDDLGRVAWDDYLLDSTMQVRVASRGVPQAVLSNARSVGFLPDGSLLVMPITQSSLAPLTEPLHTLAEKRCGFFSVWKVTSSPSPKR